MMAFTGETNYWVFKVFNFYSFNVLILYQSAFNDVSNFIYTVVADAFFAQTKNDRSIFRRAARHKSITFFNP